MRHSSGPRFELGHFLRVMGEIAQDSSRHIISPAQRHRFKTGYTGTTDLFQDRQILFRDPYGRVPVFIR